MNRTLTKWLMVVFAALGLGVSTYLSYEHYRFLADPDHKAICDVNATISCREVTTSPWSEVALPGFEVPLPISIPGMGFFAAALAVVLLGWAREERFGRRASGLLVAMQLPALAYDAWLAWVSATQIGAWCLFCLSLYVGHLALFLLAWADRGGNVFTAAAEGTKELFRPGPAWVAGGLFLAVTTLAQVTYASQLLKLQSSSIRDFLAEVDGLLAEAKPIAVERGEHTLGTPGAPYTLVEYADFECPHCRMVAPEMHKLVERYRPQVSFVFRHYPLDQACNPNMQRPLHKTACLAAQATECADREGGRFWDMHKALFAVEEPEYSEAMILGFAEKLGLDRDAFYQCLQDESVREGIRKSVEGGKALKVGSTPTVFLNGVPLAGGMAPLQAELVLRDQLKKQGKPLPPPLFPAAAEVK